MRSGLRPGSFTTWVLMSRFGSFRLFKAQPEFPGVSDLSGFKV